MTRPAVAAPFPIQTIPRLGGGMLTLGVTETPGNWQLVVVYRGLHCPLCKAYLSTLQDLFDGFTADGVEVVAVSGDGEDKARAFADEVGLTLPVGYGMTTQQMQALGLWISTPRSPKETDRPFPEPGLFVINAEGMLQVADISNAPWARPDLAFVRRGIAYVRQNGQPIRGTYSGA
ncbi:redoxin domain-containing protein [Shimia biformata]|uniref:redoxin domain-containing protein n=1 Tax=Shimia biformata TaxID=1294299 RepID=UPI00194F9E62|nr:redoxin domain-containing protein [Shimia biformata]